MLLQRLSDSRQPHKVLGSPLHASRMNSIVHHGKCGPCPRSVIHRILHTLNSCGAGILPFARELLRAGTRVTLAANETPSINDVTAAELRHILALAAEADQTLGRAAAEQMLQLVSTGTDMCVIDLRQVRGTLQMLPRGQHEFSDELSCSPYSSSVASWASLIKPPRDASGLGTIGNKARCFAQCMSFRNTNSTFSDVQVSTELAEAAEDVDLVILEGMGRAIETNLRATFACDALKLGMVKHPEVAAELGGRVFDCVCKFDRGLRGSLRSGRPASKLY